MISYETNMRIWFSNQAVEATQPYSYLRVLVTSLILLGSHCAVLGQSLRVYPLETLMPNSSSDGLDALKARAQSVLTRHNVLVGLAGVDPKLFLLISPSPSAFAVQTPSGFAVLLSAGALIAYNEDILTAILAHEIGHVAMGHIKSHQGDKVIEAQVEKSPLLVYDEQLEIDADMFAIDLLTKAQYPPDLLLKVLLESPTKVSERRLNALRDALLRLGVASK